MRLLHEIAIFDTVKSKVIISLFETVRLSVLISLRNLYYSLNNIKQNIFSCFVIVASFYMLATRWKVQRETYDKNFSVINVLTVMKIFILNSAE